MRRCRLPVADPPGHRFRSTERPSSTPTGRASGTPGPGGWAWAVPGGRYASGAEPPTTNQRMEIMAVVRALEALDGPVSRHERLRPTSSTASGTGGGRDGAGGDGATPSGKPVANRDLWEPLLDLALDPGRPVRFGWVKGHSGDPMNDRVDQLAVEAAAAQTGRAGEGSPG